MDWLDCGYACKGLARVNAFQANLEFGKLRLLSIRGVSPRRRRRRRSKLYLKERSSNGSPGIAVISRSIVLLVFSKASFLWRVLSSVSTTETE